MKWPFSLPPELALALFVAPVLAPTFLLAIAGSVVVGPALAWLMLQAMQRVRHIPTAIGSGLVISWSGMRGIVSLAAAMALPPGFPYRDLIVLTAFSVVLGTLVIQGLTLKPLLRALDLRDGDPVGRELGTARERALRAGLASLANDDSAVAPRAPNGPDGPRYMC